MKLKTLKDFKREHMVMDEVALFVKLKAEAIKHVKAMFNFYHYDAAYQMMVFFNITEEDLR